MIALLYRLSLLQVNFDIEELGGIRKIRIEHDNPHTQSGWGLDKVG